ncbi:AAA family ATPase [Flavobacterium quisquiliarum]|uniref:AAA family ATPase n=1 Tax=Flavobacterium quisquiliarum TaxID=1834436 RepID=A0ABV8WBJ0_9FLAO|nr:AAA family ATPase [Flavobacterium quisquiliarum]MBW1657568.1 AAA family ATPase [Flavobacterium quisquiliarum]
MAKNITFELSTVNLGPHESLNTKIHISTLEMGIYANNGTGKTFLSRAFRLLNKEELDNNDSNKLLTIGKNDGSFKFKITNSTEPSIIRELEFSIKRDKTPNISKDTTDYIFRVFNDDYIKENLEGLKYKPNGEIEGYILGKEKIDLTKEKDELKTNSNELKTKEEELKLKVAKAIKDLDDLSIRKNTGDYQNITFNNLFNREFNVVELESFNDLISKHNQLKALPDNLQDLRNVSYLKKTETLDNIISFLDEKFSRSSIADSFKTKIKNKQGFVETGISLLKEKTDECPFCEQNLEENALKLIDQYLEYLSETEAIQIKKANDLLLQLNVEKKENNEILKSFKNLEIEYLKNQKYIPSLASINLKELEDLTKLESSYKIIDDALEKKKEDISISLLDDSIKKAIKNLQLWIQDQNEKISKKQKVVETFTQLLTKFFGSKYSFDDKTFCIKFKNHLLESNASDVLSNGEKSIVAFCYFIAESHRSINKEEDYSKLFFIIDDPISSQDFHFVYATSQIIRTLDKLFNISRLRLIILTHNLEFMSIIIRNKVIDQKFILENNKLETLGNELIMPYEEHLRDIYEISQGTKNPSHTTPNSLRHVLETINRFIAPDIDLNTFCERIDNFTENEFLYSLMHDGSHGIIRLQKPYTDQMIKSACNVVSDYVLKDFSGQIKIITS